MSRESEQCGLWISVLVESSLRGEAGGTVRHEDGACAEIRASEPLPGRGTYCKG